MKIILSGILENISTRNEGSVKVSFGTQELEPRAAGDLFQLRGKFCKILLSDSNITQMEEKLIDSESMAAQKPTKSPSKRLRNTLWIYWGQQGSQIPFEDWYNNELDRITEGYKSLLVK